MTISKATAFFCIVSALLVGATIGWLGRGVQDDHDSVSEVLESPRQSDKVEQSEQSSPTLTSGQLEQRSTAAPKAGNNNPRVNQAAPGGDTDIGVVSDSQTTEEANFRRAIPVSDAHKDFISNQFVTDKITGKRINVREALESEPVDEAWSYFMEQTLQLFISSHPEASKFTIFHIECRTTVCEIQAIGFDESTRSDWSRILYDMSLQPWYRFSQVGTFQNEVQGRLAIVTRLIRLNR